MASRTRKVSRGNSARKLHSIDGLHNAIVNELQNYSEEITYAVKDVVLDVTDRMVDRTKRDAQVGRRRGKYKKAISSKTLFENEHKLVKVWHVKKPHYRLAHLLNNGHIAKNGGFVQGNKHITKNEELAKKELEEGITKVIKNGF